MTFCQGLFSEICLRLRRKPVTGLKSGGPYIIYPFSGKINPRPFTAGGFAPFQGAPKSAKALRTFTICPCRRRIMPYLPPLLRLLIRLNFFPPIVGEGCRTYSNCMDTLFFCKWANNTDSKKLSFWQSCQPVLASRVKS